MVVVVVELESRSLLRLDFSYIQSMNRCAVKGEYATAEMAIQVADCIALMSLTLSGSGKVGHTWPRLLLT